MTAASNAPLGAARALRGAIHARLAADTPLQALVGNAIHDVPPKDAAFPFVTLGEAVVSDWSTATEGGSEQALTLHVFSRQGGRAEALAIASAVQEALHEAPLALDGHRLANLRATTAEIRRDSDGRTFHGLVRFRAITEPL
ncbi:DUF3168 domain-containing protein [Azorhizobium sp. AG788]|uniref:DUF3168 domain-containing protein n=1 Tax=Azorhizobium sp. AG788 TaxID=2183897 RepID=UPI0031391DB5